MKGMIKKDLIMIKSNYKAILLVLILFMFYSYYFDMNMSLLLPFMGLMSSISTINYDDFNNFHLYASSFPQGKINVIKSKYITTVSIIVVLGILSILLNIIMGKIKGNALIGEDISFIVGILLAMIFMMSILFPVLFKYGAEKGRIAMILVGLSIFAVVILFTKVIKVDLLSSIPNFIDKYFIIIFIVVCILMLTISYNVSKKIYLKREF